MEITKLNTRRIRRGLRQRLRLAMVAVFGVTSMRAIGLSSKLNPDKPWRAQLANHTTSGVVSHSLTQITPDKV